ncbi:hypothetical protein NEISICOT_02205 [Neisseria sicca ATCC 29256]|uniref:Uncharacterized protein n=1 Tax=Neisseria sicca ATCC 29256 TaxID=547045 RepID=C6M6Q3_NEISI|nr:hypothetical protein NEISICOT_02205 [Neisseria sicca ATCC 29256]
MAKSGRLKNGFRIFRRPVVRCFELVEKMALGRSASALLIYTVANEQGALR